MIGSLQQVLTYVLFPVMAIVVGGVAAAFLALGPGVRSSVQHFAAGVVFAALAGELLPDVHHQAPLPVIVGFALGVAVMLGVRRLSKPADEVGGDIVERPMSLIVTVCVDLAIDGLLIGIAFAVGVKQGILLTVGLTLEVLFLGLSTAGALSKAGGSRAMVIITMAGLALLLVVGAVLGATLLAGLAGAPFAMVLAFGSAALLYLVTEELLVEAHEVPETPVITAMFFGGFILLFIIEMIT